jgi:hypothetical protein
MKRKFTKYPNNKVYAAKAFTKRYTISEPILVSSNGNFKLIIEGGIGTQDTPYTNFEIKRSAKANEAVVDIHLSDWSSNSYEGMPVITLPRKRNDEYVYVNYGFRGQRMSNAWIRDTFIPILDEAIQFCDEVNNFFASTGREELAEMCKDVFLDMGIDYEAVSRNAKYEIASFEPFGEPKFSPKWTNDPGRAISEWFKYGSKYPSCVCICARDDKAAQELLQYVVNNEDEFIELYNSARCPYKLDYLLDACRSRANRSKLLGWPGDQVFPFDAG